MKLAIMQPYFFPYLGYYSLIKHTHEFIIFDSVQYIRHGWLERNRILKHGGGSLYVQVPVSKPDGQKTLISSLEIRNDEQWKKRILSQLEVYKRIAPHYREVMSLVQEIFRPDFQLLTHLNQHLLLMTCQYLGMNRTFPIFSEMGLAIETPKEADEWALNICKAYGGVSSYFNPPGGKEFFLAEKYEASGISLNFLQVNLDAYDQKRPEFEPGLSILDVMMFNDPQAINQMLDQYRLI
ncbi:MAG: WbqC family protein [Algoriphagus sp.]|nr:WbqC family protein [Algoriphagus sp.]